MTYKSVYTLSEMRYLWKKRGNKNYEMKCLNTSGNLIQSITFKDIINHREVSGKLVASAREGEAYHWPRLMHENLSPLLDIVSINENVSIYITTASKRSLRVVISEEGFQRDAACLNRKKSYAEDVLWGLDYLHGKNLCLMNLSEDSIYINEKDKAVITDFSHLVLAKRATKNCVSVPALYRAPELDATISLVEFDAIKAEIWACGAMLLQMFTGYTIPATYTFDRNLSEFVSKMDRDVLIQANIGASGAPIDLNDFRNFIRLFLCMDPISRAPVKLAALHTVLKRNRIEYVIKQRELNCLKTEDMSQPPPCDDGTENCPDICMGKHEEKITSFDYMEAVTPLSDAIINREKLKQYSPYNKFINLKHISNRRRQEDCILDSLSSNQLNWYMQPIERERITQEINRKQIQAMKKNTKEIIVQKAKSLPNTYGASEGTNNHPLKTCANTENFHLKSFTNISTLLHEANEKLKQVENGSLANENNFQNDFSESSEGISKDTMDLNAFHPMVSINNSCMKIANDANHNSVFACTSKLQPAAKINNSSFKLHSPKSLSIFPNSSFPCLYPSLVRGSLNWNITVRRSVSSDDTQLMRPRVIPNPLILDNNVNRVHNESVSILKWRHFYFQNGEKTVGEGDRKSSPWKTLSEAKTSGSYLNVYSERKTPDICSPNSMKASDFDIQETEEKITSFLYQDKLQCGTDYAALSDENGKDFKEYFNQRNCTMSTDSKSLNNEAHEMASCSNGTMERNNSAGNSHEHIRTEDNSRLKNFNSNLEFVLKENNCMGVKKEQVDNCSFRCDIPEGFNVKENGTNNIPSVTKDLYEQIIEREQQLIFLNPTFDTAKWGFETRQGKYMELNDTNSSENEIKQGEYTIPEPLDLQDHIGVFERNLSAFSEVSLCQEHSEETVKSPTKEKGRKKSWFRYLCPGCKVYRDDK